MDTGVAASSSQPKIFSALGPFLSHPPCESRRMRKLSEMVPDREDDDVIALFGQGRLVRVSRMLLELRGGLPADEIEALGWVSMFMPEAVLAPTARRAA